MLKNVYHISTEQIWKLNKELSVKRSERCPKREEIGGIVLAPLSPPTSPKGMYPVRAGKNNETFFS